MVSVRFVYQKLYFEIELSLKRTSSYGRIRNKYFNGKYSNSLQVRAIFNVVWKIIRNCIDYAALHSEIGPDHLYHSFDQSNAKTETKCNLVTFTLWHVWNVDFPRVLIDFLDRHFGLLVSTLDLLFLRKTLYSHSGSHLGVQMDTGKLSGKPNKMPGVSLQWTEIPSTGQQ